MIVDQLFQTLLSLEAEINEHRGHQEALAAAVGARSPAATLRASQRIYALRTEIGALGASLHAQVTAVDSVWMGEAVHSYGELGLRAVTIIVCAQLAELQRALSRDPLTTLRTPCMYNPTFSSVERFDGYVRSELACGNGMWLRERCEVATPTDGAVTALPSLSLTNYRRAIRAAQAAVRAIGDRLDAARFLCGGVAQLHRPDVQAPCQRMAMAFQVVLDAEPDPDRDRAGQPALMLARRVAAHQLC